MKILTYISRAIVGALFIVSGVIKANDTLGFSYKLEEYFENGALAYRFRDWFGWDLFSLEFLMNYTLPFAIFLCAAEIILGLAILIGVKIRFTLYSLLAFTTLFFILTLHTATCDEHASYTDISTIEYLSPAHDKLIVRMESNDEIVIIEENSLDKTVTYKEQQPVQCVNDCGCFGDAMKGSIGRSMTPWESWWKDVTLMLLLIPNFIYRKKIKMNTRKEDIIILSIGFAFSIFLSWVFGWYFLTLFYLITVGGYLGMKRLIQPLKMQWLPLIYAALISLIFIYYTYSHLPLKDYRAYAVGKSIPEQMVLPDDAIPFIYENIFYYKNRTTGEVEKFTAENYPWKDTLNYVFDHRDDEQIQEGDVAAISDFSMFAEDGNDYAQDYFNEEGYIFVVVAYNINETDSTSFDKINTFVDESSKDGNYFVGLTASSSSQVEEFRHANQAMFEFLTCDAITLKTIVRANPGIFVMKKGTIVGKWNANDLPDYATVKKEFLN